MSNNNKNDNKICLSILKVYWQKQLENFTNFVKQMLEYITDFLVNGFKKICKPQFMVINKKRKKQQPKISTQRN